MYEHITYDVLLNRMLERVPGSYDKREGSIIYNAVAPVAFVLSLLYQEQDKALNNCYSDTADMESLKRIAKPFGIIPTSATPAVLYAEFTPGNINVMGRRFTCGELSYVVTEYKDAGGYSMCRVTCEQTGAVGNTYQVKSLLPIDYIEGLETANLGEIITSGKDEEDLESYRKRVFNEPLAFGGNVADYKRVTLAAPGVTGVKVVPYNGSEEWGTVSLYIQGKDYGAASDVLIAEVEAYFSMYANGTGLTPIGHEIKVYSAEETVVVVGFDLTLENGYTSDRVMPAITEKLKAYFAQLRQAWSNQSYKEGLTISSSRIYYDALSVAGVKDAVIYIGPEHQIGAIGNYTLLPMQIPIMPGGSYA